MDANAALAELRKLAQSWLTGDAGSDEAYHTLMTLLERWEALDGWLSKGGPLPAAWRRQWAGALAPVVLVYGDPASGFTFVGPVTPNDPDLDAFVDSQLRNVTWWHVPIRTLAEVAEN